MSKPNHPTTDRRTAPTRRDCGRPARLARALTLAAATATAVVATGGLAGCANDIAAHGNRPTEQALGQIKTGVHGRGDVQSLLGTPSATSAFGDETWYYISNQTTQVAFLAPRELRRQVVAVRFDPDGTVRDVSRLTLDDGQKVDLVDRETPTRGTETTVLQELLGNIGRFTPGQLGR